MKQYKVEVADIVTEQLRAISHGIAYDLMAPASAKRVLLKLRESIESLSEMPNRVALTQEEPWHQRGVHKMVVGNYLIYFIACEDIATVKVLMVTAAKQDQVRQLSKMDFT